jgi:hypothetical protein
MKRYKEALTDFSNEALEKFPEDLLSFNGKKVQTVYVDKDIDIGYSVDCIITFKNSSFILDSKDGSIYATIAFHSVKSVEQTSKEFEISFGKDRILSIIPL